MDSFLFINKQQWVRRAENWGRPPQNRDCYIIIHLGLLLYRTRVDRANLPLGRAVLELTPLIVEESRFGAWNWAPNIPEVYYGYLSYYLANWKVFYSTLQVRAIPDFCTSRDSSNKCHVLSPTGDADNLPTPNLPNAQPTSQIY